MSIPKELVDLPKDWKVKPPYEDEIPHGVFIIQCDAGYKKGITGISTIIKTHNKRYKPIEVSARTKGPVHAELKAIEIALKRFNEIKNAKKICIIYSDSLYACYFIWGIWKPNKGYIKNTISRIDSYISKIDEEKIELFINHTKSKFNKQVDKRALKKRKQEEKRKLQQIADRITKVEKAIIRGREIKIYMKNGKFFALPKKDGFLPGYKVSLEPLSCECPWWTNYWGDKKDYIIKGRALPCKHMCALAEYLGIDIYSVFKKQIGRFD